MWPKKKIKQLYGVTVNRLCSVIGLVDYSAEEILFLKASWWPASYKILQPQ